MTNNCSIAATLAIICCSIFYRVSCCGDLDIGEVLKDATLEAQKVSETVEKKDDELWNEEVLKDAALEAQKVTETVEKNEEEFRNEEVLNDATLKPQKVTETVEKNEEEFRNEEVLNDATLKPQKVTETVEKKEDKSMDVLEAHNIVRKLEQAANMNKLVWDDTLAAMATNYAAKCTFTHGQPEKPESPYPDVGQNLHITSSKKMNYTATVWTWLGEKQKYDFDSQVCSGRTCGHYIQLVWADSILLGCGYHYCNGPIAESFLKEGFLIVCNYVPPGNFPGMDPFVKGEPCSGCSDSCEDGLCITEY